MDQPSPKHASQVAEIAKIVRTAFLLAHQHGASGGACCDAALTSFLDIVSIFGSEQQTIDALPCIRQVLEQRMQARVLSEAERHSGTVH